MRLTDILQPDCVKVPLEGDSKQACIYELIDLLVDHTEVQDADALKQAVWQRELTRTTGIGHGIGIPHGKAACCDELRMAIGRPAEPLEFGAIDRIIELVRGYDFEFFGIFENKRYAFFS